MFYKNIMLDLHFFLFPYLFSAATIIFTKLVALVVKAGMMTVSRASSCSTRPRSTPRWAAVADRRRHHLQQIRNLKLPNVRRGTRARRCAITGKVVSGSFKLGDTVTATSTSSAGETAPRARCSRLDATLKHKARTREVVEAKSDCPLSRQ